MHPSDDMQKVIGGKHYSVKTATLIASDEYWDGHNWERRGTNTFLYRTRGGAFFQVRLTQWQGERDTIVPLSFDEAKELYDSLEEQLVSWDEAFGEVVVEAGRPPLYGEKMVQTAVWLPAEMVDWIKAQVGSQSEVMRRLIQAAMADR